MFKKQKVIDWLCATGAPLLLVVIACSQIYLTSSQGLTRWKGGGFGMFSTVDSPRARFLRVYIVTEGGDSPVKIPNSMADLAREVRSIPTKNRISELSAQLAQLTWIIDTGRSSQQVTSLPNQDGDAISNDRKPDSQQNTDELPSDTVLYGDQPQFRALEQNELDPGTGHVNVQAVRVELWRYNFDKTMTQISAKKLIEETANVQIISQME